MTAPQAPTFDQLHHAATGRPPHPDLARIAATGLTAELSVPAGTGPSGVILAWLWRRLYGPGPVIARTPRRLIWALPPRSPLEPTAGEVKRWLAALELSGPVALHVALGARSEDVGDWRENMHRPAIVVGTVDTLAAKALNRGYGTGPALYPIDFALVTNGAQWVLPSPERCRAAAATLRRLAGWAARWGTAEPFGLTLLASSRAAAQRLAHRAGGGPEAVAAAVRERHRAGTVTLAVLPGRADAQAAYRRLRGGPAAVTLLHSQFRGTERAARLADALGPPPDAGRIVVTTEEAASGLELPAATVLTFAAPSAAVEVPVLSPAEFSALFDTSPALSDLSDPSADLDVAPYLLDAGDLDVEVAWATWEAADDAGAPGPEVRHPAPEFRCRVPIGEAVGLAGSRPVWRMDHAAGEWRRARPDPRWRPRPFELLLVDAADGGYEPETGFDPASRRPVPESPELAAAGAESAAPRKWQALDEHSEQVRDQAAALVAAIDPAITSRAARAAVVAGYLHDAGKAHPTWQDALCALAEESDAGAIAAGRPWAKSGTNGHLEFAGGAPFRHELASLLLIDGPLRQLLADSPEPDLTRYLVLAHHGLLRVQVRDPAQILGAEQGATSDIPLTFGQPPTTLTVDLAQFDPAGPASWTAAVRALRERHGPFVLAYLETLVRIADWRASGGKDLPVNKPLTRGHCNRYKRLELLK